VAAPWLGPVLIPHPQSVTLLRWLSLALLTASAQAYFISLLNGHRRIDDLVKSQAMGPLVVIGLIFPMIWLIRGGYAVGFVLMLMLPGAAITLAAIWRAQRKGELPPLFHGRFHRGDAGYFIRMSGVLLATGLVTSGTHYFQSWILARRLGLQQTGEFWVAWALSMSYVTLLLGSYGTYYMPSLTRLTDPEARRALIRSYLRLSLMAMPMLVSLVILFKPLLVHLMFSHALLPSLNVMRWMLIGDYFKGISWVLAFPMLAFNEMKWFFWTEVLLSLYRAGCIWAWVAHGGSVEGLGALFLALYILYAMLMTFYVRKKHGFRWHPFELAWLLGGVALVLASSLLSWNALRLTGFHLGVEAGLMAAFLLPLLNPTWRSGLHARPWSAS
jgi:PST family polysaccharide transporter